MVIAFEKFIAAIDTTHNAAPNASKIKAAATKTSTPASNKAAAAIIKPTPITKIPAAIDKPFIPCSKDFKSILPKFSTAFESIQIAAANANITAAPPNIVFQSIFLTDSVIPSNIPVLGATVGSIFFDLLFVSLDNPLETPSDVLSTILSFNLPATPFDKSAVSFFANLPRASLGCIFIDLAVSLGNMFLSFESNPSDGIISLIFLTQPHIPFAVSITPGPPIKNFFACIIVINDIINLSGPGILSKNPPHVERKCAVLAIGVTIIIASLKIGSNT